jgi:hypothetical protein
LLPFLAEEDIAVTEIMNSRINRQEKHRKTLAPILTFFMYVPLCIASNSNITAKIITS